MVVCNRFRDQFRLRLPQRSIVAHPSPNMGVDNRVVDRQANFNLRLYLQLTILLAIAYIVPIGKHGDASIDFSDNVIGMILAVTNRQVGLKYVTSH